MSDRCGLLEGHGIHNVGAIHSNLDSAALYEHAVRRGEGRIAEMGPFVAQTGQYTGRSPGDKFIVDESSSSKNICWSKVNRPIDAKKFDRIFNRQLAYIQDKELFVQDCYVGADSRYQLPIRVITETAWHSLFARNMFIRELDSEKLENFDPEFTILHTPHFLADPEIDGTASEAFVLVHFGRKMVLIGGTRYAGEIKKSAFSIMNYLLPMNDVLGMHCSANYGSDGDDVALFFGLSGTGKTTLSASPDRTLIGDDEHGWSDNGVFNFEGGCYAKVIGITAESEPEIFETTRRFGTVLENVGLDPETRQLDLDDNSLTENTRAAYPITHIPHTDADGVAGHPKNIIFLTYDAFGVLPPVSRLSAEQASYHFLSGYTSKVAGTERGITEPQVTFSACFGDPFMPLPPEVYGRMLSEKIARHDVNCWLINTGLMGGAYGVGERMSLKHTRAIVSAILSGAVADVPTEPIEMFQLSLLESCPGVPQEILNPRNTWSDPAEYDKSAEQLANRFRDNYQQKVLKAA